MLRARWCFFLKSSFQEHYSENMFEGGYRQEIWVARFSQLAYLRFCVYHVYVVVCVKQS